jgi:hypothetical protein
MLRPDARPVLLIDVTHISSWQATAN